jgi:hypothetical protein
MLRAASERQARRCEAGSDCEAITANRPGVENRYAIFLGLRRADGKFHAGCRFTGLLASALL